MWFACVHYCATETVLPGYVPVCLCTHLCVCMFECVCVRVDGCVRTPGCLQWRRPCVSVWRWKGRAGLDSINQARLQRQRGLRLPSTAQPPLFYVSSTHAQPNNLANFLLVPNTIVLNISENFWTVLHNINWCTTWKNFCNSVCESPCLRIRSGNFKSTTWYPVVPKRDVLV